MIAIVDKRMCCGCEACINVCPQGCISPILDEEGFLYPKVDLGNCVDCHMCEKVCPELSPYTPQMPKTSYAAWIKDSEIRLASSSGGVFSALAEWIIKNEGVVYGASFNDELKLVHTSGDKLNDIAQFRGSKYLQSRTGETFRDVKKQLNDGKLVLYSGTGCQISGLKHFLSKDYTNLLTVEVICHGSPSPQVWEFYIDYIIRKKKCEIKDIDISFRDKRNGWKWFGFRCNYEYKGNKNFYFRPYACDPYMKCFLKNLILRPSCYACPTKEERSGADMIIGDFWGIQNKYPQYDDNKGCSAVIVLTDRGLNVLKELNLNIHEVEFEEILKGNHVLKTSVPEPDERKQFWLEFNNANSIKSKYDKMCEFGLGYKETRMFKCKEKYQEFKEKIIVVFNKIFTNYFIRQV